MKLPTLIEAARVARRNRWVLLCMAAAMVEAGLHGADTNAPAAVPPPMTPQEFYEGGTNAYNNWIELATGGFIYGGNKAQMQQDRQSTPGPFGGISDFHYQEDLDKATSLTADGRVMLNEKDLRLNVGLNREKLGYLKLSYTEFRTWSSGDGGFFPPTDQWYQLQPDALALDRGQLLFEAGLRMENLPNITFKYTHDVRDGDKASTEWGYTHPGGGTAVRGLSPSFYDINERNDAFQLDVSHHIQKTEFGVGLRYEIGKVDDALKVTQFPGEIFNGQSIQQKVTDRQITSDDLFNVHAFTETWFKKSTMFSSGFSYSDLDNKLSGSRIYGSDFDVAFVPNPQSDFGYFGLNGGSRLHEYVLDLNLLEQTSPHFSIVPSLRAMKQDTDANVSGTETLGVNPTQPFMATSSRDDLEVRERLDMSYTGVTNWVFAARAEFTEGQGNLSENGGLGPVNGFGIPTIVRQTDDSRFFQKYSVNARWYPARLLTFNLGGYYKLNDYDYRHNIDSTPNNDPNNRYPAYLVMQNFETYDGNAAVTFRPLRMVSLVTRYEYQASKIHTEPDPISGLGETQSADMVSHIFGQNINWTPWSRLNLQVAFNYVVSETKSPVTDYTSAILAAQNNYWTLNFFSGLVLDDKTDLDLNYLYYNADNYQDISLFGVPYGAGAQEHGVTAALVRRIRPNVRVTLKYGFYHYTDQMSGGNNDYQAHLVSANMQYRF